MSELYEFDVLHEPAAVAVKSKESLKPIEEYLEQSKIPQFYGIPCRVSEQLQQRIGKQSLSIDSICEPLNITKRTLQRRLQQSGLSFAELRDQVRYHYAVNHLIDTDDSIDKISSILDFSDRTSFTNAFKRWCGMSPSVFRKRYRFKVA